MACLSLCGSGFVGGVRLGRKGGLTVFVTGCVVSVSRLWCIEGPVVVSVISVVLLGRVVCLEGGRPAASLGVVGLCVRIAVLYMLWLVRFGFGGRMCPCVLSCAVLWGGPVVVGVSIVVEGFVALPR